MNPFDFMDESSEEVTSPGLNVIRNAKIGPKRLDIYYRDVSGKTPEVIKTLSDLLSRNQSLGGKLDNQVVSHIARNREFFEKGALLNIAEAGRMDVKAAYKSFFASAINVESAQARHGFEIEVLRAKVVASSTGIPLHKKVLDQHQAYLAGKGEHPLGIPGETPLDPYRNQKGYYHLERSKSGHNVVYMNDIYAGSMVIDMDGDEATLMLARRRDKSGNVIEEFMIPYKEPLTQRTPSFRNINYEHGVKFDRSKLFGTFSGLNFTNLGERTDPNSIKTAFSGELAARKYSVVGDFLRAYDKPENRGGFSGVRDLATLQKSFAEKSLKTSEVGLITNMYDQKAIIETVRNLHEIRQNAPDLYRHMLLEQQEAAKSYLATLRGQGNEAQKILGTKVFGQYNAHGINYETQFEGFLENLLKFSDDPAKNVALRKQLERHTIATGMLDDVMRIYETEVGALKQDKNVNAKKVNSAIISSYREYIDDPLLTKVNSITSLKDETQEVLMRKFLGGLDDDALGDIMERSFLTLNPENVKERAQTMSYYLDKMRKPQHLQSYQGQSNTTLHRIANRGINGRSLVQLQELNGFEGSVTADHLKNHMFYREAPLAITLRDTEGNIVGPHIQRGGQEIAQVSLMGNVVAPVDGSMQIVNRREYLATELERRLEESLGKGRGFGEISQGFHHAALVDQLEKGSTVRTAIAEAYGINPMDVDQVTAFGRNMAGQLRAAGANSTLHQDIVLQHDMFHRKNVLSTIHGHIQDIVAQMGGLNDAAVNLDPQTGLVTKVNPLNIRRISGRYGLDTRGVDLGAEDQSNFAISAIRSFGGYISKNTSSGKNRYLQMSFGRAPGEVGPVGIDPNLFMPMELAKRSTDIQRQMANGAHLGKVRMVLAETDIPHSYFNLTNPDASMGLKRPDEGVVLISKSFRNRAVSQIKEKLQIGPTLKVDEYDSAMNNYIEYMLGDQTMHSGRRLTGVERTHLSNKFSTEFKSMYNLSEIGGKQMYSLNEKGMDSTISRVFKLGSYLGDKAVVHTVDDLRDSEGKLVDILMHVNQSRSRANEIARYQQVIQTAVNEGRIGLHDLGPELRESAAAGMVNFQKLFEAHGGDETTFMDAIKQQFIAPLQKAQQSVTFTDAGKSHSFQGLVAETEDFFATGAFGDVYKDFGEVSIQNRTLSRTKLLGRIANSLESELGQNVAGIGIQFGLHAIGSFAEHMNKAVIHDAYSTTQAHVISHSRQLVEIARSTGTAMHDAIMDEAGIPKMS